MRSFASAKEGFALALITPAVLVIILFQLIPIFIGTDASFREWTLNDPKKTWVGLEHYIAVLNDPYFIKRALPNSILFAVSTTLIALLLGLAIALLLHREIRGRWLVQTIVLLPLMVAPVIVAIMLRWIFNDQFGIVSFVVESLGFRPPPWLASPAIVFTIGIGADIWHWAPWFTILLLAALTSMPREPFEAAKIDGASAWRTFRYITLPILRPIIVVCITIRSIDAFRQFDVLWTLSNGGPGRSNETVSMYAYVEAFHHLNFARGAAAATITAIISIVIGAAVYRILTRVVEVSR